MFQNKKTKVYVLGASGFLGGLCAQYFRHQGVEVVADRVDVTDFTALRTVFKKHRPDAVINFAGAKAYPTIDWCEDHKEETVRINVSGAINAMTAALEAGCYPIQISSGCIYSCGPEKQFTEEDAPNFFGSFYSRMRIVLQNALAELPVLSVRIRMPMSMTSHPRNIIDKIVAYKKVISIPNSVTLIEDLWPALKLLLEKKPLGVLNLTNEGYVEHKKILEAYKKIVDPKHVYELINLEQLEGPGGITKAKRSNCVLSIEKAKRLGISMPALEENKMMEIMGAYKMSLSVSQKHV